MFTFLAIGFVVLLLAAIFYGFGIVVRKPPTSQDQSTETCSLCRKSIDKDQLVERQVGDSRLYFFCTDCIQRLYDEARKSQKSPT